MFDTSETGETILQILIVTAKIAMNLKVTIQILLQHKTKHNERVEALKNGYMKKLTPTKSCAPFRNTHVVTGGKM